MLAVPDDSERSPSVFEDEQPETLEEIRARIPLPESLPDPLGPGLPPDEARFFTRFHSLPILFAKNPLSDDPITFSHNHEQWYETERDLEAKYSSYIQKEQRSQHRPKLQINHPVLSRVIEHTLSSSLKEFGTLSQVLEIRNKYGSNQKLSSECFCSRGQGNEAEHNVFGTCIGKISWRICSMVFEKCL